MGWEPAEVTTYEYDDTGRLVQAVTVREAEFSAWDRAVLIADRAHALAPRGDHGLLLSETTDPANQGRYTVPLPTVDFAAKKLADEKKKYAKQWGDDALTGTLWRVELTRPG